MEKQNEFLFADGPNSDSNLFDPRSGFYQEVSALWHLPLGEQVRVLLRQHDLLEVAGRLELERAPDLPLNARESLHLSAGGISFLSTQVQSWSMI